MQLARAILPCRSDNIQQHLKYTVQILARHNTSEQNYKTDDKYKLYVTNHCMIIMVELLVVEAFDSRMVLSTTSDKQCVNLKKKLKCKAQPL